MTDPNCRRCGRDPCFLHDPINHAIMQEVRSEAVYQAILRYVGEELFLRLIGAVRATEWRLKFDAEQRKLREIT